MLVRCIDNSDWGITHLTIGKTYQVLKQRDSGDYHLVDDNGVMVWTMNTRFEIVKESIVDTFTTTPVRVKAATKDDRQAELEFFKATQPGHCACGMLKSMCDYHRG